MAKIPFSKLQASINNEVIKNSYQNKSGEEIFYEVKLYLPFQEKLELMTKVINQSIDDNGYYNPMRVKMFMTLEIVYAYTNLTFTEKMKEDIFKLYDILVSTNIFEDIIKTIGNKEFKEIKDGIEDTIKNIYEYKNSVLGILDAVSTDYENLNLDALALKENLSDDNNLKLLKDVMTKLG